MNNDESERERVGEQPCSECRNPVIDVVYRHGVLADDVPISASAVVWTGCTTSANLPASSASSLCFCQLPITSILILLFPDCNVEKSASPCLADEPLISCSPAWPAYTGVGAICLIALENNIKVKRNRIASGGTTWLIVIPYCMGGDRLRFTM